MPSKSEVAEVLDWCWQSIEKGTTHYRGMTYEEGVKAAIEWMNGETKDRPDSEQ